MGLQKVQLVPKFTPRRKKPDQIAGIVSLVPAYVTPNRPQVLGADDEPMFRPVPQRIIAAGGTPAAPAYTPPRLPPLAIQDDEPLFRVAPQRIIPAANPPYTPSRIPGIGLQPDEELFRALPQRIVPAANPAYLPVNRLPAFPVEEEIVRPVPQKLVPAGVVVVPAYLPPNRIAAWLRDEDPLFRRVPDNLPIAFVALASGFGFTVAAQGAVYGPIAAQGCLPGYSAAGMGGVAGGSGTAR